MMNTALAGLVVLVIGDGQMVGRDYLLNNIHDGLRNQGAIVHSYGMCGTVPWDWLTAVQATCGRIERQGSGPLAIDYQRTMRWSVMDLIDKYHPDLVVVELGDTMAGYGSAQMPLEWISEEVHALTSRLHARNISCAWVGPVWGKAEAPYYKTPARVSEFSQLLAKSVEPCRFIDSTAFAKPGEWPMHDAEHLTPNGYRLWGQEITASITAFGSQVAEHKFGQQAAARQQTHDKQVTERQPTHDHKMPERQQKNDRQMAMTPQISADPTLASPALDPLVHE